MATMKKLLTEGEYGSSLSTNSADSPFCQTYHQSQMNHHAGKALETSRMARNHSIHAEHSAQGENPDDTLAGQHGELSRAYGSAAKAHLALADHHSVQFKKERSETVKDMTKPITPKNTVGGKDGVKGK